MRDSVERSASRALSESSNAIDMLFLGDPIDAEEAYRIGLINRLTEKGRGAEGSQAAGCRSTRSAGRSALRLPSARFGAECRWIQISAIDLEFFMVNTIYGTEDKHEGIAAFLEKRDAKFKGR